MNERMELDVVMSINIIKSLIFSLGPIVSKKSKWGITDVQYVVELNLELS